MTGRQASPRALRYAAAGLFVALPLAALGVAGLNVLDALDTSRQAAAQEDTLARMQRAAARSGAGKAAPADGSRLYLDGSSRTLATAALQQLVVAAVATADGKVIETQDMASPDLPDGSAALRVTFDSRNTGVMALLYGLETGLPLLNFDQVGIREIPAQGEGDDADPTLRVDLVVRGYWRAVAP